MEGIRISVYIAQNSRYSRRAAGELVKSGVVSVSGGVVTDLSYRVLGNEVVSVSGEILKTVPTEVWLCHKKVGSMTSSSDPWSRPTVYDSLPNRFRMFMTIGRLDRNTEGLLLFTNNGKLSAYFELPANQVERVYDVTLSGACNFSVFSKTLEHGLTVHGIDYKAIKADLIDQKDNMLRVRMSLFEGKNREIRKIAEYFGLSIQRLTRVGFGKFELGDIPLGGFRKACPKLVDFYLEAVRRCEYVSAQ